MKTTGKWHALLTTARLPNAPSVVSNVWMGVFLGIWWFHYRDSLEPINLKAPYLTALALSIAGVFLYVGGNFFNDWHDHEWDKVHRPERALPSGLFAPVNYLNRAARYMGLGVVCAAIGGGWACVGVAFAIVVLILIYTRWHKVAVWPVIPMGLCRALLPVMGFLAMKPEGPAQSVISLNQLQDSSLTDGPLAPWFFVGVHAAGLFGWIAGLTLNARYESIGDPPPGARFFARLLLAMPFLCITFYWVRIYPIPAAIGMVPLGCWLYFIFTQVKGIGPRVSLLLAGIPLVEWVTAMPLATALRHGHSMITDPLTGPLLLLPALAFLTARRLQQWVSAT